MFLLIFIVRSTFCFNFQGIPLFSDKSHSKNAGDGMVCCAKQNRKLRIG